MTFLGRKLIVALTILGTVAVMVSGAGAASTRNAPYDAGNKSLTSVRDATGQGTLVLSASHDKTTGALSVTSETSSVLPAGGSAGIPVNVGPIFFPAGGTTVAVGKNYGKASASVSTNFSVPSAGTYTATVRFTGLSVTSESAAAAGSSSYSYAFATVFMYAGSVWNGNCGGPASPGDFTVVCTLTGAPSGNIRVDAIVTADTSSTGNASAVARVAGTVSSISIAP